MGGPGSGDEEMLTDRLVLRRPRLTDVAAIFAVHNDPRACAHNPSDMLTTPDEARNLFHRWDEHWQRSGFGYWVVARRHAAEARLGFCGLKFMRLQQRRVLNLFYRFDPTSWGDGIASEAASAIVRWASTRLPDHPVIARVRPANVASQRVATRAGLVRAEPLDCPGLDGLDWIFVSSWPEWEAVASPSVTWFRNFQDRT